MGSNATVRQWPCHPNFSDRLVRNFSGAHVGLIDAQHAVMAGASVTLYGVDRGFERQTKTNREGEYAIELVPPGKFTLRAEAAGFAFLEMVCGGSAGLTSRTHRDKDWVYDTLDRHVRLVCPSAKPYAARPTE